MAGQIDNYPFDYMAIPDEFHDNWTAKLSGDQFKIMVYLLGRLMVSKHPLNFTINGLFMGTGVSLPKIEKEIKNLSEKGLITLNLQEGEINWAKPLQIDTRFLAGKG